MLVAIGFLHRGGDVQDRGRAVPLLDAGRLPGRARRRSPASSRSARSSAPSPSSSASSPRRSPRSRADWLGVFLVLTVLTMTVGNVVALTQMNVKRMLAYSSIAHTGYIMAGLAAFAADRRPGDRRAGHRVGAVLRPRLRGDEHRRLRGGRHAPARHAPLRRAWARSPASPRGRRGLAAAMAVLMLSLTGIPPTVGFFAKLYVLLASVDAGLAWLAVIIVLNAALAAFYYLRVIVYMYMRDPEAEPAPLDSSPFGIGRTGPLGGRRRAARPLPRRRSSTSSRCPRRACSSVACQPPSDDGARRGRQPRCSANGGSSSPRTAGR